MTIVDEDVRLAVYAGFAERGTAPARDEIAAQLGATSDDVRAALERLAQAHTSLWTRATQS